MEAEEAVEAEEAEDAEEAEEAEEAGRPGAGAVANRAPRDTSCWEPKMHAHARMHSGYMWDLSRGAPVLCACQHARLLQGTGLYGGGREHSQWCWWSGGNVYYRAG